jgi:hypothetical protein
MVLLPDALYAQAPVLQPAEKIGSFKHGFLHACRHRPQRGSPRGNRQPVPNRGLAAVTLILLLAFTLCSALTLRHSELFRRYRKTTVEVAHQLHRSLSKLPPRIRAPDA